MLHSSQIKTIAFRPGFTEFLGKSSIFASSVIYPSVLKSLSTNSFHCLTLLLPENMQKNPLVLRNNCRRDPRSLPSTDTTRAVSTRLTCHRCRTLAQTGGRSEGSPCTHLKPGNQKSFSEKSIYSTEQFQHLESQGSASPS